MIYCSFSPYRAGFVLQITGTMKCMYESKCDFTVGLRDGGKAGEKELLIKLLLAAINIKRHEIFNS